MSRININGILTSHQSRDSISGWILGHKYIGWHNGSGRLIAAMEKHLGTVWMDVFREGYRGFLLKIREYFQ